MTEAGLINSLQAIGIHMAMVMRHIILGLSPDRLRFEQFDLLLTGCYSSRTRNSIRSIVVGEGEVISYIEIIEI